jgi:hypothetical protein
VAALTAPGQQKTSLYPSYFDVDLFFHSEHLDRTTLASGIIFSHGVYTWQTHTVCSALLSLLSCAHCCVGSLAVATPPLLHYYYTTYRLRAHRLSVFHLPFFSLHVAAPRISNLDCIRIRSRRAHPPRRSSYLVFFFGPPHFIHGCCLDCLLSCAISTCTPRHALHLDLTPARGSSMA